MTTRKYWRTQVGGICISLYNETDTFTDEQIWGTIKFVMKGLKVHFIRQPSSISANGVAMWPRHIAVIVRDCACCFASHFKGRYIRPPNNKVWFDYDNMPYNGVIIANMIGFDDFFPRFIAGWKRKKDCIDGYSDDEYLNKLLLNPMEELISTLAHEFRHVWQDDALWLCDKVLILEETGEIKRRSGMIWGAKRFFSDRDADAYAIRKVREYRQAYNHKPIYHAVKILEEKTQLKGSEL